MDIKIQPPRKDATLDEIRAWCARLAEEINLVFEILEAQIKTKKGDN